MHYLKFKKTIWDYHASHRRDFPWRNTKNPYFIVVSEIMLQQTQTHRVLPKYKAWLKEFPTFETLAKAPLKKVLSAWQGLGYNRRAIALQKIAQEVVEKFKGKLPQDEETLISFPGIGPNTAGSILAFAFNKPTIFIETNIRTVYIHFFFEGHGQVDDQEIRTLVEKTVDKGNSREWYYALMDYGVMLKKSGNNLNEKSLHYRKQSTFKGSNRELRANIVKSILNKAKTEKEILELLNAPTEKIKNNLIALEKEGFITKRKQKYHISS